MTRLRKLLCACGFHKWVRYQIAWRQCGDCEAQQRLRFYSNRTQAWEDI